MKIHDLPIALLGVPLINADLLEAGDRVLRLMEAYRKDLHPRYLTAINSNGLAKAHNWNWGNARHPELLQTLREVSFASAESRILFWLPWLLGEPLKDKITAIELLSEIADRLDRRKLSCYLLGGTEKAVKLCSLYLQASFSNLTIAGMSFTKIDTEGVELSHAEERDMLLVEQINRAAPDVLFLNLGCPKQELWFNRLRDRLHVPITVGVNGAFEQLTGVMPKIPKWAHQWGLQQKPSSLWRHYVSSFFKICYIATPLIIYHNVSRFLFSLFYGNKKYLLPTARLFISPHQTVAVIRLPARLNYQASKELSSEIDDLFSQDVVLFDFCDVRHVDLTGVGLILKIWQRALREKKRIYGIHVSLHLSLLLRFHRVFDLVRYSLCVTNDALIARISQQRNSCSFYDSVNQMEHGVVISFFGRFDHELDVEAYIKKIEPIIHLKECWLDFTYCTYIETRAIGFLVKLAQIRNRQQIPPDTRWIKSFTKKTVKNS